MITDRNITTKYNLTWSFIVDSNFKRMVRLHFCKFQLEISTRDKRVFEIFVASLVANPKADVIRWTGERGIRTYHRDYVVDISAPASKKINLSVAIHPAPKEDSIYADALLNGIEVFKISNNDGNWAGPNPDPIGVEPPPQPSSEHSSIGKKVIVAIAGGSVSSALLLVLMCFLFYRRRSSKESINTYKTSFGPLSYNPSNSTMTHNSSLPAELCRHFSLAEIKSATNDFDEIFIVGVCGFGSDKDDGSTVVSIKRLNHRSQQGARSS